MCWVSQPHLLNLTLESFLSASTSTLNLTVTNVGPVKLDIALSVTKPEIFQISQTSLSLEAGKSGTFAVTFNPLSQLIVNANVLLTIPGLNSIVGLKGRGTPAARELAKLHDSY